MKSRRKTYFFIAPYAFRSKVLILIKVKKIRDLEKIHPDSESRIQGVKKHMISDPDPYHCDIPVQYGTL
jgi:hypothetical protein